MDELGSIKHVYRCDKWIPFNNLISSWSCKGLHEGNFPPKTWRIFLAAAAAGRPVMNSRHLEVRPGYLVIFKMAELWGRMETISEQLSNSLKSHDVVRSKFY